MKKERLSNSGKTFRNQWEPVGFCKLPTKKHVRKFPRQDCGMLTILILSQSIHRRVRTTQRKGENQR